MWRRARNSYETKTKTVNMYYKTPLWKFNGEVWPVFPLLHVIHQTCPAVTCTDTHKIEMFFYSVAHIKRYNTEQTSFE
jgi:hypothetical protein